MSNQVSDRKIELIQWLSVLDDERIIEKLLKIRQQETEDWWNSVSSEEEKSIEQGISDADNGKLQPHSTARKMYEKWL